MKITDIIKKERKVYLSPSLLACDFSNLAADLAKVETEADMYHFDIMDGNFVPNISFGFPLLEAVRKVSNKPLDLHLMIERPERYFERFKAAGANSVTFHIEAVRHVDQAVNSLHALGMGAAIALNPATPVSMVKDILPLCDMILIMSVNPGYGGQKFITYTLDKIKELKELIRARNCDCLIEVDGGVKLSNCRELYAAGADVLVAGTEVFHHENPQACLQAFRQAIDEV